MVLRLQVACVQVSLFNLFVCFYLNNDLIVMIFGSLLIPNDYNLFLYQLGI